MAAAYTFSNTAKTILAVKDTGDGDSYVNGITEAKLYAADIAGTLTLKAATACTVNITLTTQIQPADKKALKIDFVLNLTTAGAGDTLDITGTDAWDNVQTESIDVSAGNGTYTSAKYFKTITDIDCTGWADGTLTVNQNQWGVVSRYLIAGRYTYIWDCRLLIGDATYFWFKNTSNHIRINSGMTGSGKYWIMFNSSSNLIYLKIGDITGDSPKNGCYFLFDDTTAKLTGAIQLNANASELYVYDSVFETVIRRTTSAVEYGLAIRNTVGEIKNVSLKGFQGPAFFFNTTPNNVILKDVWVSDCGAGTYAPFHQMSELTTPPTEVHIFDSDLALQGMAGATPNADIWDSETHNINGADLSTVAAGAITLRLIDCNVGASPVIQIASNSNPQAIELCTSLQIQSEPNARVYLKDASGANGLSYYSGSRLAEALDISETGIDMDDGMDFAIGNVMRVNAEQMLITGISTNTLTVTRGYNGTTAATHADNTWVWIVPDCLTLDANGNISVTQPEGTKNYVILVQKRWATTAETPTTFSNHKITIKKSGYADYKDTITSYPIGGIKLEVALERPRLSLTDIRF